MLQRKNLTQALFLMDLLKRLGERLNELEWKVHGKWVLLSALVGIVAGLGAILFQFLTQLVMHVCLERVAGYYAKQPAGEHAIFEYVAKEPNLWLLVAVAAAGGLVSGLIVYTFAPEAEGHGTDAAIDAFHNKRGAVRARIPVVKTIASAITIGTGGSGGREGPIAQIGAGFGSLLAVLLKVSARDRRILLAAGMGAGVGAIFRAPLAGALFAAEILYSDSEFEADVIVPADDITRLPVALPLRHHFGRTQRESLCDLYFPVADLLGITPGLWGHGIQLRRNEIQGMA